jgi:hypothetical protein
MSVGRTVVPDTISVNGDVICNIDDINYYYLSLEELKNIVLPIISGYMYSLLSDAIRKEIINSIQKAVDIECKSFIRDEKIDKILE